MVFLGILASFFIFSIMVVLHELWHYSVAKFFGIHVDEFGLWIPPRAKKLWKNASWTLFSLNWIPLGWFVKIAGESEISFEYFDKKGVKLSLENIETLLMKHDDIFDIKKEKISKAERKYLKARLKNYHPGKNFFEKNIFQKSAVLLAGVIMNFLLAGVIFSSLFFVGVSPVGINTFLPSSYDSKLIPTLSDALENWFIQENPGIVLFPTPWSIAEKSWIMQEDILIQIDWNTLGIDEIPQYIQSKKWEEIELYIERKTICPSENQGQELCATKEYKSIQLAPNSEGKIWSYLAPNYSINNDFNYKYSLWNAIKYGFLETYSQIQLTFSGLKLLWKNVFFPETPEERSEAIEKVSGPIGIVSLITDSLAGGIMLLFILWAIISVNLWVFNLLPIPALDGWRLLLLWIRSIFEILFGKNEISGKIENLIHVIFFLLLIALSLIIAYNDIIKIFLD